MKTFSAGRLKSASGRPKVAVPVSGATLEELAQTASDARAADMIELRLDGCGSGMLGPGKAAQAVAAVKAASKLPVLLTYRTKEEGGEGDGALYGSIVAELLESAGADLVDLEFSSPAFSELLKKAEEKQVFTVASKHFFSGTPGRAELKNLLLEMQEAGADCVKAACMPLGGGDVEEVLSLGRGIKGKMKVPYILISMGEAGMLSRLGCDVTGSAVTFAAVKGRTSAPGQLDADELIKLLDARQLKARRKGHIFLTGYMGTGKSTVAKAISKRSGLEIFEMDAEIEKAEGMGIPEIFAKKGQPYFRQCEQRMFESLKGRPRCVVSCGGGAVLSAANVIMMKQLGVVVLLKASPQTILTRVSYRPDARPNLKGRMSLEGIAEGLKERQEAYRSAADIMAVSEGRSTNETAAHILKMISEDV